MPAPVLLGGVLGDGDGDGDGEAEGFELADVAADLAFGADALVVVAGSRSQNRAAGSASRWKMMTRMERATAPHTDIMPR
jgi:hypothetical protein